MDFFILGYYKGCGVYGSIVYNSKIRKVGLASNKYITDTKGLIKEIRNVKFKSKNDGKDIFQAREKGSSGKASFNPALMEDNNIIKNVKTLVFIDINENKVGIVDINGNLEWVNGSDIEDTEEFNNVSYNKNTGYLILDYYIAIGNVSKYRGIKINQRVENDIEKTKEKEEDKTYEKESKPNKGYSETYEKEYKEDCKDIKEDTETDKTDSKEIKKEIELETDKKENKADEEEYKTDYEGVGIIEEECIYNVDFYRNILKVLRDNDIITIPKDIVKELGFRIIENIERNTSFTRLISLGTIKIDEKSLIVLIKNEADNNDSKLQILKGYELDPNKSYDLEVLKENYFKWRKQSKYISL